VLSAAEQSLIAKARERALRLVTTNVGAAGLSAGGGAYPEVWARDAVITALGLLAVGDRNGRALFERSIASLAAGQSPLGRVPNHVYAATDDAGLTVDTVFAGAVDASLWFIVSAHVLGDGGPEWAALERAHLWLQYQDVNECGLLEVHESMDWADLFANRYNSLVPNVLWYGANRAMAAVARRQGRDAEAYDRRADDIRFKINQLLWVGPEVHRDLDWITTHRKEWEYPVRLVDTVLGRMPHYLPYMAFRDYGSRFDTLGNLLAVLFGLADERQSASILDYMFEVGMDEPWPVKACWPPVEPGEKDWREYYRLFNLNHPHQYHNAGAWPFLGGFYVAALVKAGRSERAERALVKLAEMNRAARGGGGEWEFNEWFHGRSGRPMGHRLQSWSAGMLLYAAHAVENGRPGFFTPSDDWTHDHADPPATTPTAR
jgi:glycogen debranching enzyme